MSVGACFRLPMSVASVRTTDCMCNQQPLLPRSRCIQGRVVMSSMSPVLRLTERSSDGHGQPADGLSKDSEGEQSVGQPMVGPGPGQEAGGALPPGIHTWSPIDRLLRQKPVQSVFESEQGVGESVDSRSRDLRPGIHTWSPIDRLIRGKGEFPDDDSGISGLPHVHRDHRAKEHMATPIRRKSAHPRTPPQRTPDLKKGPKKPRTVDARTQKSEVVL